LNYYAVYRSGVLVAHYLAPSATRAAFLAAGAKGDAGGFTVLRMPDEPGPELRRAAEARRWREGRLDLEAASCTSCEGSAL